MRIALSTLATRRGGTLGAFAAVSLAVILVVSCGILLESSLRAPIPVERLRAAAVVVQGDPTIEPRGGEANVTVFLSERRRLGENVAARVRRVPGVAGVIDDRSVYAQVVNRSGRLLTGSGGALSVGHGWESAALTPYTLVGGHRPRRPAEVVLDEQLAADGRFHVGDRVRIVTITATQPFTVSGIAAAHHGRDPDASRHAAVFFRDDVAARLSGDRNHVDLIGILTERGADPTTVAAGIRDALHQPDLRVLTGAKRGEAESPSDALGREDIVAGLTVFGALAAFIAIFVVASTFALSVQQRHRELALFRAIGSTPRQVRRMVLGEALLVSALAFVIAAPIGLLVAHLEKGLFTRAGMVPVGLDLVVGWLPFAGGLVVAIITTQCAAFASARRASRIRPTDALREATVQRRPVSWVRGLVGLAALAGGVAVLFVFARGSSSGGESDAPAATMVLMLAAALLGPLLALPFAWLLGLPLAAFSRGPGMLAHANTRANLRRTASVATPVMLAISLICTILFAKTALQHQTTGQTAKRTTAGYVLQAHDAPGLPHGVATAVRRLPGVAGVSGSIATTVVIAADGVNLRSFPARGVEAETLRGVIDLGVSSGSLADLRGEALAVSTASADSFGWRIGDRVHLWLGDGTPATLRVAATFVRPLGFAEIVLPRALVERHVTQPLDDAVFVKGGPQVDQRRLHAGLQELRRAYPTVEVLTRSDYRHQLEASAKKQSLAVYVLLAVIGIFCAMALVNAMAMATAERAREFALLRLVGASRRQVRTMIRGETTITIAFGLTLGSIIAAPGLAAFNYSLTGSAVPTLSLRTYGGLLAFYAVLAFVATVLPTRLALRMNPVKAMAARE